MPAGCLFCHGGVMRILNYPEGEEPEELNIGDMCELVGSVALVRFYNEENGYTVLDLSERDLKTDITVVGCLPKIDHGEYIRVEAEFGQHSVYGEQYKAVKVEFVNPTTKEAAEEYLASGVIKGIGKGLAARIVKKFGDETFAILDREPERLAEVKGISMNMAMGIAAEVSAKREMRDAIVFLQQFGITLNMATKIYKRYRDGIYHIIKNNPYKLADDINGIGFERADDIAMKAGIRMDSEFRIKSGILYTVSHSQTEGHTCLPFEEALNRAARLLEVDISTVEKFFSDMVLERTLVIKKKEETDFVYASSLYYMELKIARALCDLDVELYEEIDSEGIHKIVSELEKKNQLEFDKVQKKAISAAMRSGFLVVTGGPGTGKTTTINAILEIFDRLGREVMLAAPTGRAAKRMTETTGRPATTIHRLLGVAPTEGSDNGPGMHFTVNEDSPLETDVLIVDEASMIDVPLMSALLKAVAIGTKLILVGDVNQLPSVGPGNVLRDIIASESFHVVTLQNVFRQAQQSDIVMNAHKINRGEEIDLGKYSEDFLMVRREDPGKIVGATITLVKDKLPKYVGATPLDIQVLTPMRKGPVGVENLNIVLQEALNPPSEGKNEKKFGMYTFREGDKVMQIRNNYQLEWDIVNEFGAVAEHGSGIFNGDCGVIKEINQFSEEIMIYFDDTKRVFYPFAMLDEIEPAYAITVHKSQGSEYPAVVLTLFSGPDPLFTRNLLYTAVTRAKKCVTVVGREDTLRNMEQNVMEQKRYSGLEDRIRELTEL